MLPVVKQGGNCTLFCKHPLSNIDLVDAALCALAAQALLAGRFQTYGDAREGFIVVPAWAKLPAAGAN
jgi:hypothetical protein